MNSDEPVEDPLQSAPHIPLPHARGGSFYFPVIESLAASGTNAVYGIHIYLGPNLSTISNATKFSSSNYVTVHIPAGESTTKTTLDTAGVSYTQDYVIS